MRSRRRSMGSSAEVSTTPPSRATMRLPSILTTPKPRLAAPGSIPITTCMGSDSGRGLGCLYAQRLGRGQLLDDLRWHVEVGMHLVDVVIVLERVDQAQQPFRLGALDHHRAL